MRSDDVVQAVMARLRGDTALVTALGGPRIYRSGANRQPQIPSLEWTIISDVYREGTERVLMQFDSWTRGYAQAVAVEGRVRTLLHRELPEDFGGLLMWAQYSDSRDHEDPEPGVIHRSADFTFEPAREAIT